MELTELMELRKNMLYCTSLVRWSQRFQVHSLSECCHSDRASVAVLRHKHSSSQHGVTFSAVLNSGGLEYVFLAIRLSC